MEKNNNLECPRRDLRLTQKKQPLKDVGEIVCVQRESKQEINPALQESNIYFTEVPLPELGHGHHSCCILFAEPRVAVAALERFHKLDLQISW